MGRDDAPGWLHLSEDEEVVWESRPHPVAMGAGLPTGVAFLLAGLLLAGWGATEFGAGVLATIGLAIALVGAVVLLVQYVAWTNTRYVITTAELYHKRGIVSRNVTQFRLGRVQNTSLHQSTPGRLLGYGTLTIYTAGSGDPELTFEYVPQPHRANAVLSRQLDGVSNVARV